MELFSFKMAISNLTPIAWFLLFLAFTHHSLSARTLGEPPPHHHRRPITFYMPNPLAKTSPLSPKLPPQTKQNDNKLPFSKPLGFFPPNGGILIPMPDSTTQTLDLPAIEIPFSAKPTLQELELGTVVAIDEGLFEGPVFGPVLVGKAQGMYVASFEDGHSHMLAMTASFVRGHYKDGLRLFGVHRGGDFEAHIAIIGGFGKYDGANGYAIVKAINESSQDVGGEIGGDNTFLKFTIYLG